MCEYMWQICWCSSSLMLSSFAQDSDLSIRLPKIVIPEPRCLPGHNSVSLSDHFLPWSSTGGGALGTSCLGSWQILPPNFLVQGSQVRGQSGICTRSCLLAGRSTMWTQRAAQEWRTVAAQEKILLCQCPIYVTQPDYKYMNYKMNHMHLSWKMIVDFSLSTVIFAMGNFD